MRSSVVVTCLFVFGDDGVKNAVVHHYRLVVPVLRFELIDY
jgi:hypothetical protein